MLEALYIIIALGLTILFHEMGHFFAAKSLNIGVEKFSIGLGPKLVSFKKGETEYLISLLVVLGGYVQLAGENPDELDPNDKKAFLNQHPIKKIIVASSGVIQNIFLAFLLMWFVFIIGTDTLKPVIGEVKHGYPAFEAGLQKGDEIIKINDKRVKYWNEVSEIITGLKEEQITFVVLRDNKELVFNIKPKIEETEDILKDKKKKPVVGISPLAFLPIVDDVKKEFPAYNAGIKKGDVIISIDGKKITYWEEVTDMVEKSKKDLKIKVQRNGEIKEFVITPKIVEEEAKDKTKIKRKVIGIVPKPNSTKEKYGILKASDRAFAQVVNFTDLTVRSIYKMIMRKIEPDVAGPIGVIQISYEVAKTGIVNLMFLFAIININLALINFVPLLPLDGGLVLIFIIEWIRGKMVPLKVQETLMQLGWMLLIFLLIFATYQDILRFFSGS
ncbi:MAG: RIP metalloprotease RseP [Candidatus Goldbacteria bacterium]|nr:RIP metalloprotease RseP [Candidatus Goldiibacteriota bacterium]